MTVAVLGFGSMGRRHADFARRSGHVVVVHDPFVSSSSIILAGYGYAKNVPAAINRADAIVVATPASTRRELLPLVLARGVPTLIEKPLARSLAEIRGLAPSAPVLVGYNLRSHPHVRKLKRSLDTGLCGAPSSGSFVIRCDGRLWPGRFYEDALLECSHEIDLALWMFGPATLVDTVSDRPERWMLRMIHNSGAVSEVELDTASEGYYRATHIHGSEARLGWVWNAPSHASFLSLRDPREHVRATVSAEQTYAKQWAHFESMALGRTKPRCRWDEAVEVLRLCDDARSMARAPLPKSVH